jgi:hypothetical protein
MDSYESCISDAFDLRSYRQSKVRKIDDGANATLAQVLAVIPRDPRDKRQVVIAPPTFVTDGRPRANIAVFDWFWVRLRIDLMRFF